MTEIGFHFNTPDKVNYACRLVRKAVSARGLRVVVVGEAPMLEAVDAALWQLAPSDFIAHCRGDAPAHMLARSPVILCAEGADAASLPHREMLVNLGPEVPAGFERFERLIDIVSDEAVDRQIGRSRWRHYADRGYTIQPHDFARSAS
ncbi:DNA polymerase-3 subunit chi [Variovorax paradoxus]|uniref:DNA polymerase III subunit chi n=1 Tax=Variovorax paradoxus TaxID=34073 RepID=UPI00278FDD6C|nr:DNA polymerase III subunit chi [Variovorax paradoxus]MDQ0570611.1 DNA polymerase-3 subunit chi [Variovorax paradoxus]